jgi:hypothetical protein
VVGALLVLVATLCTTRTRGAEACSGIAIGPLLVTPRDAEVDVPIDVVPLVTLVSFVYPSDLDIRLTDWNGDVVPADVRVEQWANDWLYRVLIVPTQMLVPDLQYRIRYYGSSTLGVFTTGSTSDDEAPAAPVVRSVGKKLDMDYSTSCGNYTVIGIKIALEPVDDVTYVVREDGRLLAEQDVEIGCEPPCGGLVGDITCDGNRWFADRRWELPPGAHTLQIAARDRSGNESPPTEVSFEAECLPVNPVSEGGGCAATGGAPGPILLLLWVISGCRWSSTGARGCSRGRRRRGRRGCGSGP